MKSVVCGLAAWIGRGELGASAEFKAAAGANPATNLGGIRIML